MTSSVGTIPSHLFTVSRSVQKWQRSPVGIVIADLPSHTSSLRSHLDALSIFYSYSTRQPANRQTANGNTPTAIAIDLSDCTVCTECRVQWVSLPFKFKHGFFYLSHTFELQLVHGMDNLLFFRLPALCDTCWMFLRSIHFVAKL